MIFVYPEREGTGYGKAEALIAKGESAGSAIFSSLAAMMDEVEV